MNKQIKTLPNENSLILLFTHFFHQTAEQETKYINQEGYKSLIVSRLISVVAMLIFIYIACAIVFAIAFTVNSNKNNINYEYWWAIPLFFAFPLLIRIVINFNNRDYLFGKSILNFLNVIKFSIPNINSIKSYWEFLFFIVFVFSFTVLQVFALSNFIDNSSLEKLLEKEFSILIFLTISISTYITVRIFGMVENTPEKRFNKSKRVFLLWLSGTVFTLIYITYTFITLKDNFMVYLPYQVITLLLAIEKTKDSYKKMEENLNILLNRV